MNRAAAVLVASLVLTPRLHAAGQQKGPVGPLGPTSVSLPALPITPLALPGAGLPNAAAGLSLDSKVKGTDLPASAPAAAAATAATASAPAIHAIANGASSSKVPAANPGAAAGSDKAGDRPGAMPTLTTLGERIDSGDQSQSQAGAEQAFDGKGSLGDGVDASDDRTTKPKFEPPTNKPQAPEDRDAKKDDAKPVDNKRLSVSFQAPMVSGLMAIEPNKSIYGTIKRVRDFPASREYWNKFKKGAEIDVVSRGESVFGRTTKITYAVTKTVGQLTREDLKGLLPEFQLAAPIRALRQLYLDQLESARKTWNPNDPTVTLATTVRVVKFQSYLDLYRETHDPNSVPAVEKPAPRVPLKVKAEGQLEPLTRFLPRAVFLDVDALDGPISKELLSDMMKLQRTGVYFVAFSRQGYSAANSLKDKLVRQMSAYQLSILMPIRFMAVTDGGAVISEFPKGGNVVPVDVDAFSPNALDIMRDASNQASIDAGVNPNSVKELAQTSIKERVEEFPGGQKFEKKGPLGPQVRFELLIPKSMSEVAWTAWQAGFEKRLSAQGLKVKTSVTVDAEGRKLFAVQKTDIAGAMPRLMDALGKKFGLYLNPHDILVLSNDPQIKAANPHLDFGAVSGLKGTEAVENALGLLLGDHRENVEGDLSGSASRMAQFSGYRSRYLSDFLVKQDGQEQNINFFSGHTVHSANDWLVYQLQNGKRPTPKEYETELRRRWDEGLREFKAVGIPQGEDMEGWERESTLRGLNMYKMVLAAQDRKEILVGTEIPNFFMLKDQVKRTEELKRRYTLHTIFDFIALRPNPNKPGHATLVIYDFKTGPAQSRQKLDKDLQVLTYALFAKLKWVGKPFQTPYMSGDKPYMIDNTKVEFIYGAVKQSTTITDWDLETIRKKIIGTLNRINAAEQKLMAGPAAKKAAAKKAAARKAKKAAKGKTAKAKKPAAKAAK